MTRSATKSLAQLLASNGHDEDDIFVARPIRIADHGAAQDGIVQSGAGRFGASIMRADGGPDFHKINALMSLLKPQPDALDDPAGEDPDSPDGDGPRDDGGTGPSDGGDGGGSGPDDTPSDGPVTPDTDTDPAEDPAGDPAGDPGTEPGLVVTGTWADETLSGGEGADTFVFGPNGGQDIISNFNVDNDTLDLRAFGFSSLDDVLALAGADGADLAFTLGTGRVVLHDVSLAQAADLNILIL